MDDSAKQDQGKSGSRSQNPSYVIAKPWERYMAYLMEIFPLAVISFIPEVGPILAMGYLLLRDAILPGQSFGKKVLKLKVIVRATGNPASMRESAIRNFPLAMNFFFPIIPIIGHLVGGVTGTIIFTIEAIALSVDKEHQRLGDKMAGTIVIKDDSDAIKDDSEL